MVAEVIQGREEERVQTLATVRVPRSGREGVKEGLEKRKSATTSESDGRVQVQFRPELQPSEFERPCPLPS